MISQRPLILRPLNITDLLDETIDLYRANFLTLFKIAAILLVPAVLLTHLGQAVVLQAAGPYFARLTSSLLTFALLIPAMLATTGAMTAGVAERYLGRPISLSTAYGALKRRAWPFIFTMVLGYAVVLVPLFVAAAVVTAVSAAMFIASNTAVTVVGTLIMVPLVLAFVAMYLAMAVWLQLLAPVVMIEDQSNFRAIKRAWDLGRSRFWVILLVVLVTGLIVTIIQLPLSLVEVLLPHLGPALASALGLCSGLAMAVVMPVSLVPMVLLYFDCRVRKEGLDIQLLAQQMGTPPQPIFNPEPSDTDVRSG